MRIKARCRGVAAVEFALVLPLLMLLVLGAIEWGWYFYTREVVVNASREGARVGTLQYAGADAVTVSTYATEAARTYVTNAGLDRLKITTLETTNASGGTCDASSSCLLIVYRYRTLTGYLDGLVGSNLSVRAYAQMRK